MKYGFLDRHADLDSPIHRLDPRTKLLVFFAAVVVIASTPPETFAPYPWYAAAILAVALVSRVPGKHFAVRAAVAAPFILTAAAAPLLGFFFGSFFGEGPAGEEAMRLAGSITLKAFASILLLTMLTATSQFAHLLWAMSRLRAPPVFSAILTLMYRHIFILFDEWRRISQARECRGGGRRRLNRFSVYGKQIGLVFLRGWERAERVHAAMIVRGFRGSLPVRLGSRPTGADLVFASLLLAAFLGARAAAL